MTALFVGSRCPTGRNGCPPYPPDGVDVLPGFALPLRDLFAELDRQGIR